MLIFISLGTAMPERAAALDIGIMVGDDQTMSEEQGVESLQRSGASVLRAQVRYGMTWGELDGIFYKAAERGLVVLPYFYGFKNAFQFPTEAEWKPAGNTWETWIYEVVQRYGYEGTFWTEPGHPAQYHPVEAWEIWNEPNLALNNPGGTTVQPQNYARFMRRTAGAIRAAQALKSSTPTTVLFGGLYSKASGSGMGVTEFLKKAKEAETPELKIGAAFDGLSLHPYSFTEGPTGVEKWVNEARLGLATYFGGKSLWVTELGWNVAGESAVNEATQASYLTQSFNWIKSVASTKNIQLLTWYTIRDNPASTHWAFHTGLRRSDGSFRPAWAAFQAQTGAIAWQAPPGAKSWAYWSNGYSDEYADVTGDGKADLIGRYGTDIQVASSTGSKFGAGTNWATWSSAFSDQYADVNGDGKADLIGRWGSEVQVAPSTGSKFTNAAYWTNWSSAYSMEFADVTGDGKADLIGRYGTDIQVASSTGTKFGAGVNWTNWSSAYSMDFADVNGDGKADLIGRYGSDVQVALSTGSKFSSGSTWTNWSSVYSMDFADYEGDGKDDLYGRYGEDIQLATSTGLKFNVGAYLSYDWYTNHSLDFADVTGDGKADVVGRFQTDVEVLASE
jgi:FG-GAP-like repeat